MTEDLRDAINDAIWRAYCAGDPTVVVTDPGRMRHLASIQAAAWGVIAGAWSRGDAPPDVSSHPVSRDK